MKKKKDEEWTATDRGEGKRIKETRKKKRKDAIERNREQNDKRNKRNKESEVKRKNLIKKKER